MLQRGASVVFQDRNAEVLTGATIPNVSANCGAAAAAHASFIAGEWSAVAPLLAAAPARGGGGDDEAAATAGQFDLVLSADTLYSAAAYAALCELLRGVLSRRGGVALLAAKRYYFGVGGGTREFEVIAAAAGFDVSRAAVYDDGASNIREVLRVTWR